MSGSMMGGVAGLVVGAALAPLTGGFSMMAGASFGFMGGSLLGGMLSPPSIPGQTNEGTRLQDLKVQSASYGRPIPIILGKMRTAGNILWIKTGGLIEERVEQTTTSGGGGKAGGGASTTNIFYNYYATCAISVCKGPIKKILKIWADSKLVYNAESADAGTQSANALFEATVNGYLGDETQTADSVLTADLGAGNVPGYRGQAYIVLERFPLKDYGNRIPNFTFEVMSLVPTGSGSGEATQYLTIPINQVLDSTLKLVLNFNGTNGANAVTDFKDVSQYGKVASATGSSALNLVTAEKVFGSASGYFIENAKLKFEHASDFVIQPSTPWQMSFRLMAKTNLNTRTDIIDGRYTTGATHNGWVISYLDDGVTTTVRFETGYQPSGAVIYSATYTSVAFGVWSALRFACDGGGNLRIYKNGVQLAVHTLVAYASATVSLSIENIASYVSPGPAGATPNIYVDEFILQKGGIITVASSYTVETTETAPAQPTVSQVMGGLLEFPDYSGKKRTAVAVSGSPVGSSAQKVFGAASALFAPLAAIHYHNASWQSLAASGEWGIGFKIRFKDTIGSAVIMSTGGVVGNGWEIAYVHSSPYKITFTHSSGTVLTYEFAFTPVADTWYTIGLSYSGGVMRGYVNGVYKAGNALGVITNNANSNLVIGQEGGAVSFYLDELIIQDTSGIYVGASDYAVPTSAFIADTNTRLLLHFDEIFAAVGSGNFSGGLAYVDTKVSNIISYLCSKAGMAVGDYNTSYISLNDNAVVPGFVMNSVAPIRSSLEMLAAAFLIDVVESQTILYFVSRNSLISGGPGAIIPSDDLSARHVTDNKNGDPLNITAQQEIEIPKEVAVKYLDPLRDYYEGSQRSIKQQTGSIGRVEINATALALTDSQAKIAAIGNHMFFWAERKKYKFTLPLKYAYLDCADMVQINFSTQSHFVRITKMNYSGGFFDVEGVGQDFTGIIFNVSADGYSGPIATGALADIPATVTALVVSSADTRGNAGTPAPATINYPVVSTLLLLDMAIISDSEDGSGYYAGVDKGATANYWPAAVVYKSSDGASFATLLSLATAMTTGQAMTALSTSQTELWDKANTVTVALTNGTLASDTEANVLNGANIGILGDEIIQWTTATLDANGYYVLSGLLRGRRGTEWAVALHVAGERFILFNTASVQRAAGVNEEIGLVRIYRGVTSGLNLADTASQNFTNAAKGLKPYSPCQIAGSRDGSNNLTITWVRRTRVGGSWKDNVDVLLSETLEQYAVDIIGNTSYTQHAIAMTSDILPVGHIASASSELGGGLAFEAFDDGANAANHGWYSNAEVVSWLAIEFVPAGVIVNKYTITGLARADELSYNVKTWTFEGWTGSAWVVLNTQTAVAAWTASETRTYTFTNFNSYSKYRVNISVNQGGGYSAIQQLKLYSYSNASAVVRSITGLTSATTPYTAAQQTADGLTPGDSVSVNIYQISSTVGRGYAGAKTI